MTEPTFEVPPVAKIPVPQKPAPEPAELVDSYTKQREKLQVMLAEATLAIESRNRTIKALELELAEARNNLAAMASQVEGCRQEVAECRVFFSTMRAQLDHFEIPLPIRRKAGNGKKTAA